jgi:hypothetical protein
LRAINSNTGMVSERAGGSVVDAPAASLSAGTPIDFSSLLLRDQIEAHSQHYEGRLPWPMQKRHDSAGGSNDFRLPGHAAAHRLARVAWTGYHARAFRAAAPAANARRASRVLMSHPGKDNNHGP